MIRRSALIACLAASLALGFGALTASPAMAGGPGGGGSAGCSGGSCWGQVQNLITVTGTGPGGYSKGGGNTGVSMDSLPPPACWEQPLYTGAQMWAWWQQYTKTGDPAVIADIGDANYPGQFAAHKGDGAGQGEWWSAQSNVNAGNAGTSCVEALPMFEWVPPGQAPAVIANIPPRELAMYAYASMILPGPTFDLNPANKTEVNLATFITNLANTGTQTVTARLGNESATVTATAGPGSGNWISVSAPGGQGYNDCTTRGTHDSVAEMNATKAGEAPDCGVLFTTPSTGKVHVTVGVRWVATWQGRTLGTPVMTDGANQGNVAVGEIQSVNGG